LSVPTATMSLAADAPPEEGARTAKFVAEVAAEPSPAPDAKQISRMKGGAERALKNAQKKLKSAKSLSSEARAEAEANLTIAGDLIKGGEDFSENDADGEAYASFQE